MCVCVCVCVFFIKLYLTALSGAAILVILCYSHCLSQGGINVFVYMFKLHVTAKPGPVVCVCVFIKLHITAQSGLVILVILCHSH